VVAMNDRRHALSGTPLTPLGHRKFGD